MQTSDSIDQIAPALLEVQRVIAAVEKNKTNPHLKNKYADLSAVIDTIKPALNDNGITFSQWFEEMKAGEIVITTQLLHTSGQWLRSTGSFPVAKLDAQGAAGASTYLRRYGLKAAVGLTDEDDDGNAASAKKREQQSQQTAIKMADATQIGKLNTLAGKLGQAVQYEVGQLTYDGYVAIGKTLKAREAEANALPDGTAA